MKIGIMRTIRRQLFNSFVKGTRTVFKGDALNPTHLYTPSRLSWQNQRNPPSYTGAHEPYLPLHIPRRSRYPTRHFLSIELVAVLTSVSGCSSPRGRVEAGTMKAYIFLGRVSRIQMFTGVHKPDDRLPGSLYSVRCHLSRAWSCHRSWVCLAHRVWEELSQHCDKHA